jgi:hypothetical protein
MTRYVPVAVGVKVPDTPDVPAPVNVITDVNDGDPEHVVFPGENTSNVTDPVGAAVPAGGDNVAVSWNDPPKANDAGDTAVTIGNAAGATTAASPVSLHAVADAL